MNEQPSHFQSKRPIGLTLLAIINGVGFIVTLLFWGAVYFEHLVPMPGELMSTTERANAATTYGFLIGDIIWSAPLLALATVGLWSRRFWGWTAAQMVNVLWIYSMTVIWFRDIHTAISPGAILFTPFTVIAVWAFFYLWKNREQFGIVRQE